MSTKIAIIGSGISGLTAAYLLNRKCDITVFEKEKRLGGHTATIDFDLNNKAYSIDTGFIVYNDWTYPNFIKLMAQLGVDTQETSMGFSVSCQNTGLEYAGNSFNALFAQRANLVSLSFLRMIRDILRFNREAERDLAQHSISKDMTLGEYLDKNKYSEAFCHQYLVPMGAAIWSASLAAMKDFPVYFFVEFFHNHGLLNVFNRPQWRVIKGGSKQYIEPLTREFKDNIVLDADIESIERVDGRVKISFAEQAPQYFDQVVIATHSDQALALLKDPSREEADVLGAIGYQDNSVVLHYDESVLPDNKRTWSSWNYLLGASDNALPVVSYNMNILQGIEDDKTFSVTLNADEIIDPAKVIGRYRYAHPQFTLDAEQAKHRWADINGVQNTWFCGAYWANGFHEDGVCSALRVAEQFGEFL